MLRALRIGRQCYCGNHTGYAVALAELLTQPKRASAS